MSIINRNVLKLVFSVGLGGIIGSLLRYSLSLLLKTETFTFPIDTFTVNICGSFLLALILSVSIDKLKLNKYVITFFTTGIIGSFTTFSTIMIDFANLIEQSMILSLLYLFLTISGGFIAALVGLFIGQRI